MPISVVVALVFSLVFSASENAASYSTFFNEELNLLSVDLEVENSNLLSQLNEKYYIDADVLYELGIAQFSTLYMIDKGIDYTISYNILSYDEIENVYIELDSEIINNNFKFSEPMSMRGVDLAQISYFPIEYDSDNHTLRIIKQVEITILEDESIQDFEESHIVPISKEFEVLLNSMVINLEIQDRLTDNPGSILYICGGSSADNSFLEDLIDWRKEQGYTVFTVNTSVTGTSVNSIKDYIEDAYFNWEYPPEFIVLVGDTSGSYQISTSFDSGGESDYPYTLIEGNDLLPEMFVGRLSANSSSDLSNIVNKTLAYEKASFLDYTGTDWYESSALVGDPSSTGNSAIITNEYIENMLNVYEFDNIQTCYVCSYSSWMQNRLEEGILYFNYRGYIGTSGFGSSHINNANNGYMTPFVTFITCATGGFSGTSISESFIRSGSVSNPKGGVAAVGTATSATHTVPNNIVDMGIYDGIFSKGLNTAGAALVNGKLSLYSTYPDNPSQMVYKFTHWNNLMGDPVLHLWKDTPKVMNVEYPESINLGTNLIGVNVFDNDGLPISGARVVVYANAESYYSYTNEDGVAFVSSESNINFSAKLTVLKDGHIPFNESISVTNQGAQIEFHDDSGFYVDDNHPSNSSAPDGIVSPGEYIYLYFYVSTGIDQPELLNGHVVTNSSKIDIINPSFEINDLSPYPNPSMVGPVELYVNEDLLATDLTDLVLIINDNNSSSNWSFNVPFEIMSPHIILEAVEYSAIPIPGGTIELSLSLQNNGDQGVDNCSISIDTNSSLIEFFQSESFIGDLSSGGGGATTTPIVIEFSDNIIDGSVFNFDVHFYNDQGFSQNENLNITVGTADEYDPLGPDSYGYYIYDWTDIGYSLTPFYDWIEIDPSLGGDGIDLGISHQGNGNGNVSNSTKYVDLPFTFTFYGVDYDEISVSANGWIAFGHSNMESFRNYQLPGAGGPSPMLAAFWDDLKTDSNSKVLKYVEDDYVIIEWKNMKTYQHSDLETFQVILYDSITPTGDDEIKIQYQEVNNTTNGDYDQYTPYHGCYSTVGIENHLANVGLEYTFDNKYPDAAAHLENNSALFITTRNTTVLTAGDVNQDDSINVLDIVMVINHILTVELLDSVGQYVADIDGNQQINILDVILIINLIFDN